MVDNNSRDGGSQDRASRDGGARQRESHDGGARQRAPRDGGLQDRASRDGGLQDRASRDGAFAARQPGSARRDFRRGLESGALLRFPGAFTPLTARLIEDLGFEGVYISGAVLSAELGLPDIGLTTLSEVAGRAEQIAATTTLPTLLDTDTGFGAPLNAARTVEILQRKGISGCHLEDQRSPKRCGHLDGKVLVPIEEMVQRIAAAARARTDPDFVICARTDARAVEGLPAAIDRARSYVAAGADMIFPEALVDEDEFRQVRRAIEVPLLANMTEFGKSPLLDAKTLSDIGFNVVIYPVTLLRIAMGAIENALATIAAEGTQRDLVPQMQTRARLYELIRYADYNAFDAHIFAFDIPTGTRDAAGVGIGADIGADEHKARERNPQGRRPRQ